MLHKYTRHPEYSLGEEQIKYSIWQQVMSKFRPKKFPWFTEKKLDEVIPRYQLERIVLANLKKHRE